MAYPLDDKTSFWIVEIESRQGSRDEIRNQGAEKILIFWVLSLERALFENIRPAFWQSLILYMSIDPNQLNEYIYDIIAYMRPRWKLFT